MVYLLKMGGSFHGYVSHNQMVISSYFARCVWVPFVQGTAEHKTPPGFSGPRLVAMFAYHVFKHGQLWKWTIPRL
jgi:hypothetical protein